MKTVSRLTLLFVTLLFPLFAFCQWSAPDAIGNMNNINAGSVVLNSTLDQRAFNPNGAPLEPGTLATRPAQVNANFGGLIIHSTVNTAAAMNMFWGQNFDYHTNDDIRYRLAAPATMQQFANGTMYFYTAPAGVAGQQIAAFKFLPKLSLCNNGGLAIGTGYALLNTATPGILLVENNIGLGTQNPAAQLHTTGTVRFAGLTTGGTPTNIVSIDANGQLWRSALSTGIQNSCATVNFLTKSTTGGNLVCSQIFDNGTSIGINQSSNFNYTGLTVVGSSVPPTTGTARLAVNGVTMSLAYFATSDERMKTNISRITNSMDKIKKLEGKTYRWKTETFKNSGMDGNLQIGFIAQDLVKIIPEAVIKREDGTYGVNYNAILPVLAEGIKEQQNSIDELKNQVQLLKSEIASIRNQNGVKHEYFSVSPNPFTQETKIVYDLSGLKSKVVFFIYDLQGKIIKKTDIPANIEKGSLTFSRDNLSAGVYIFSFSTNNKELQMEKIILNN